VGGFPGLRIFTPICAAKAWRLRLTGVGEIL